jgi:Transposase IS200 like
MEADTKTDLKAHLIWLPKYRKRVLTGPVAIRTRDVLWQRDSRFEIDPLYWGISFYVGRYSRIGTVAVLMTLLATLPRTNWVRPVRPWVDMAMRSKSRSRA